MQTRLESAIEAVLNVGSGMLVAWIMTLTVLPGIYGYDVDPREGFEITCIFTVVSVLRSYLWRRFFNGRLKKGFLNGER